MNTKRRSFIAYALISGLMRSSTVYAKQATPPRNYNLGKTRSRLSDHIRQLMNDENCFVQHNQHGIATVERKQAELLTKELFGLTHRALTALPYTTIKTLFSTRRIEDFQNQRVQLMNNCLVADSEITLYRLNNSLQLNEI